MINKLIKDFFLDKIENEDIKVSEDGLISLGTAYLEQQPDPSGSKIPEYTDYLERMSAKHLFELSEKSDPGFFAFTMHCYSGMFFGTKAAPMCWSPYSMGGKQPKYLTWEIQTVDADDTYQHETDCMYMAYLELCFKSPYLSSVLVGSYKDAVKSGCLTFNMGACGRRTLVTILIVRGFAECLARTYPKLSDTDRESFSLKLFRILDSGELNAFQKLSQAIVHSRSITPNINHHIFEALPAEGDAELLEDMLVFGTTHDYSNSVYRTGKYNCVASGSFRSAVRTKDAIKDLVQRKKNHGILSSVFPNKWLALHEYQECDLVGYVDGDWYDNIMAVTQEGDALSYGWNRFNGGLRPHDCFGGFGKTSYYFGEDIHYIQIPCISAFTDEMIWKVLNTPVIKEFTYNDTVNSVKKYGFVFRTDIHPTALLLGMITLRVALSEGKPSRDMFIEWGKVTSGELLVRNGGAFEISYTKSQATNSDVLHKCVFEEDYPDSRDPHGGVTYRTVQGYFLGLISTITNIRDAQHISVSYSKNLRDIPEFKSARTKVK